jgi:hypothetical protein
MAAAQLLDRKAELGDRAGLEVLHEHVGTREHRGEQRLVACAREIEAERFLAAVEPDEIRAFAVRQRIVIAREIAFRPLHLDDARARVGQPAARHRRRHRLLERHHQQT